MDKSKKRRIWLMGLLVISLAFNLLVIGMMIGRAASPVRDRHPHLGWMMYKLDRDTRAELHDSLREHRQKSKPIRAELQAAQRRLHEVLSSEDFDAVATRQALTTLRDISARFQTLAHQQMVETLAKMKPEDRVQVYRFLAKPGPRGNPPCPEQRKRQ